MFLFLFISLFLFQGFAQDGYVDSLFNKKLYLTREILTRPSARNLIEDILADDLVIVNGNMGDFEIPKGKNISETQLMMLMDQNPEFVDDVEKYVKQVPKDAEAETATSKKLREKWKERFTNILSDEELRKKFRSQNNPLEPYEISDKRGYSKVKTYVNHPRIVDGKTLEADDLKKVWIDQIRGAKKEISINVYDFDLEEIADELIKAKERGIKVKVGIDKSVIEERPEVKKVFDKLKKKKVFVHAVDSVGLNHQKMMAIDWSLEGQGKVVFSSGNLTQSCLGMEGDLKDVPAHLRPKKSIPNANHVITMNSDSISSIISHEISKTIDHGFQLRGKSYYPMGGVFKVWGEGKGKERSYLLLAFSPNGALKAPNKNFISQAIANTTGPVKMVQFAYSSEVINDALLARAKKEIADKGKFVFKSVGDTPFAMMDWSKFLNMSGLELIRADDKAIPPKYIELEESEWKKVLGEKRFNELRNDIRVAPEAYGNHYVEVVDEKMKVTSKIHHKLLITGEDQAKVAVTGSFNFSNGAETNQEYLLMFKDEKVTKELEGAADYLYKESKASVFEEAYTRNIRRNFDDAIPEESAHSSLRLKGRFPAKKKCNELLKLLDSVQKGQGKPEFIQK